MKSRKAMCLAMVTVLLVLSFVMPVAAVNNQSPVFVGDSVHANYTFYPAPISFEGSDWDGRVFAEIIVISVGTVMTAEIHAFTYPGSRRYASILTYADGDWESRETIATLLNEVAPFNARTVTHTFDTPGEFLLSESWVYGYEGDGGMFRISVIGEATQPQTTPTPQPTPTPPPADSTQAPNVSTASSWARDGINEAFALGLIPQNLQSNYTQAATRAEFSALAVALYETVTGNEIAGRANFNDTNDINVQKMGYLGIVTGVGGGNFAPNNTITREQAAVLIARLAYVIGQPLPSSAPTFADNTELSLWAVDGVGQVQAAGIMGGVGSNRFSARGEYTREQSIITMLRLFDLFD